MKKLADIGFFENLTSCNKISPITNSTIVTDCTPAPFLSSSDMRNGLKEDVKDAICDYLTKCPLDVQASIYSNYCYELLNSPDDAPRTLEYDETDAHSFMGLSPYVNYDGYGHLQDWYGIEFPDEVAEAIVESGDWCGDLEIKKLLKYIFPNLED